MAVQKRTHKLIGHPMVTACGIERRNRWRSIQVTSTRGQKFDCKNCLWIMSNRRVMIFVQSRIHEHDLLGTIHLERGDFQHLSLPLSYESTR
jgi:hypothetical protein